MFCFASEVKEGIENSLHGLLMIYWLILDITDDKKRKAKNVVATLEDIVGRKILLSLRFPL